MDRTAPILRRQFLAALRVAAIALALALCASSSRAAEPAKPAAPLAANPSKERSADVAHRSKADVTAQKALVAANAQVSAGNDSGAVKDLGRCVAEKPSSEILGECYKNLGILHAKLGENAEAVRYFKLYEPLCPPAEHEKIKALIAHLGT